MNFFLFYFTLLPKNIFSYQNLTFLHNKVTGSIFFPFFDYFTSIFQCKILLIFCLNIQICKENQKKTENFAKILSNQKSNSKKLFFPPKFKWYVYIFVLWFMISWFEDLIIWSPALSGWWLDSCSGLMASPEERCLLAGKMDLACRCLDPPMDISGSLHLMAC